MSSKGFLVYLISASSVAVFSVFLVSNGHGNEFLLSAQTERVWPELHFSWKIAAATVIGFIGSALGTVGGVGAGGIFVPMLNLIVGFDSKSAAALSKCMIMAASMSSVWYNLRVEHPTRDVPIIDYDLALIFQPMLMLGITIGVSLSVVFPYWLISVLIIVLFLGTSSRSFFKASLMWKEETILKNADYQRQQQALAKCNDEDVTTNSNHLDLPLLPRGEKSGGEIFWANIRWKGIFVLMLGWSSFLLLQILNSHTTLCSPLYWVLNVLQVPVAIGVYGWESVKLFDESKERRMGGNDEFICEATIEWNPQQLLFCGLCGVIGGIVGGLLGSGGGFILGPLLLEIGVIPQVASATATFVMMFSSSLSVVEFYLLDRFPIPYALYLMGVSILAGFWGQYLVRKLVVVMKRASVIVFTLSTVIFVSALIMGVVGLEPSIEMMKRHEYMGFLSLCDS